MMPFSASPYYDFLDAFILGFSPDNFFRYSEQCITDLVALADDAAYLRNNISDFSKNAWEAPVINFTRALAGPGSSAIVNCELMAESVKSYATQKYAQFDSNMGTFFTSFLFNIMGNALRLQNILKEI
jgi:hypothetical protein